MSVLDSGTTARLTPDQRDWLRVRQYLQSHRHELATATDLYPDVPKVAGTPLLTRPDWMPTHPLSLSAVGLNWTSPGSPGRLTGAEAISEHLRPLRPDGTRYPTYSAAVADLAAPGAFENRSTYSLRGAHLAGGLSARALLEFGSGSYFDGVDIGDACAHEYAAYRLGLISRTPLRDAVGDPCDPARRPINIAISTLTLRHDPSTGQASFPLHWRDPAKVGHAGGMYMVMPVGVFQASSDGPQHQMSDFSLWRCMLREFAEELLGESEDHDGTGPIDYGSWPLAAAMTQALGDGRMHAHVLGLGVDPLTLATDLLTAVTIDAELYDDLFGAMVQTNSEGRLFSSAAPDGRFPLTATSVEHLTSDEPLQAAGAALIRLALTHRDAIASSAWAA